MPCTVFCFSIKAGSAMSPYGKGTPQLSQNEMAVFFYSKLNDINLLGIISS